MPSMQSQSDSSKRYTPIELESKDARGLRFETRRYLVQRYYADQIWEPNLIACGQPLLNVNGVLVQKHGERAGFGGLKTCGRSSVCPVCAAKVGSHRASEIEQVCSHFANGTVVMLTLTMRHNIGQSLEYLWNGLTRSWKAATNGRGWRRERDNFGISGYVCNREATWGYDNGWHLHVHALLFFEDNDVTDERIETLSESMFYRWSAKLVDLGLDAPTLAHGVDWKRVGKEGESTDPGQSRVLASYLTKIASGIGFEVGNSTEKKGRMVGHFSPWQLAQMALTEEDDGERERFWRLWNEWRRVSLGKRFINWSRGLRQLAGLGKEKTDEEIAAEGDEGDLVASIPAKSWRIMRKKYPRLLGEILTLVEAGHDWENLDSVVRFTDSRLSVFPPPAHLIEQRRLSRGDPEKEPLPEKITGREFVRCRYGRELEMIKPN